MQKLIIVTFVLRALGFVLVLLSLFGHDLILNVFHSGIGVYFVGAVIYFFVNKKRRADRRREEIEEAEERASQSRAAGENREG